MEEPELTTRWAQLRALLAVHPDALLNAVDGTGRFVPLPPALASLGVAEQVARSGAELVDPVDLGRLLQAWEAVQADGRSVVEVHSAGQLVRLHLLDLRAETGVVVSVAVELGAGTAPAAGADQGDARPRLGRTRKDATAHLLDLDDAAADLLEVDRDAVLGRSTLDLLHPDDRRAAVTAWVELLDQPGSSRRARLRHRRRDGGWVWLDVINHNRLDDPEHGCVVSDLIDVSQEMAYREDVKARERLLQRLTQALPVGVAQVDPRGRVQYANDRLGQLLGGGEAGTLQEQFAALAPPSRAALEAAFAQALATGQDRDLDVHVGTADRRRRGHVSLRPLVDEDGASEGVLVCLTDVTESTTLREELERRVTHDALTGCLTRAALLQRLEVEAAAASPENGCAVVFLDLDGFKQVNDTHGHDAGDALLSGVGAALLGAVRAGDQVGRLGGDEFVVVSPGVPHPAAAGQVAAAALAAVVAAGCRASAGVAWSDGSVDADDLLRHADAAMYEAKRARSTSPVAWTRRRLA